MATSRYDTIILGGGIAGLMTAVRLAQAGQSVGLFERGLLGGQATTGNHGMLHAGSFYAKWHPEIVPLCREALALYPKAFPTSIISQDCIGFGKKDSVDEMKQLWSEQDCWHEDVEAYDAEEIFRLENLDGFSFVRTRDTTICVRQAVLDMARMCRKLGVKIHVHTPVSDVLSEGGWVTGVRLVNHCDVHADRVVMCTGLGTNSISQRLSLKMTGRLRSRLDMMVAFDGSGLDHLVLCHDFGGPNLAPGLHDTLLASPYGGVQPPVRDYGRWSVPVAKLLTLIEALKFHFHEDLIDYDTARAYMCAKTEMATGLTDQFGGQPGFAVVDHGREDGIDNLWTLLPGKMTLAFHASHSLAEKVLKQSLSMELAPVDDGGKSSEVEALVERYPWEGMAPQLAPEEKKIKSQPVSQCV